MALNFFLTIEGIPGESLDAGHPGAIELLSWSWGETQTTSAVMESASSPGKAQIRAFHATAHCSSASPKLFTACASGQQLARAVLQTGSISTPPAPVFMTLTFTGVIVSSYQVSGT